MIGVSIRGLRKSFDGAPVLNGVDLDVEPGETMVIVGGSGEGKSVLLKHIIGLERADAGEIKLRGMDVETYLQLPPREKPFRVSMVFQNAALLNSLNVGENVGLRLQEHGLVPKEEIPAIVARCLEQVDLVGREDKMPGELSGGMRKRVAIARALAAEPHLILYDEPTADLDPILTEQIGALIKSIQRARGTTQIVVTHNLTVAQETGDHIAMLHRGRIVDYQAVANFRKSPNEHTQEFIRAAMLKI